jgi:hypothetical protein
MLYNEVQYIDYEWYTGKDVELQKAVFKIPLWDLLNKKQE